MENRKAFSLALRKESSMRRIDTERANTEKLNYNSVKSRLPNKEMKYYQCSLPNYFVSHKFRLLIFGSFKYIQWNFSKADAVPWNGTD